MPGQFTEIASEFVWQIAVSGCSNMNLECPGRAWGSCLSFWVDSTLKKGDQLHGKSMHQLHAPNPSQDFPHLPHRTCFQAPFMGVPSLDHHPYRWFTVRLIRCEPSLTFRRTWSFQDARNFEGPAQVLQHGFFMLRSFNIFFNQKDVEICPPNKTRTWKCTTHQLERCFNHERIEGSSSSWSRDDFCICGCHGCPSKSPGFQKNINEHWMMHKKDIQHHTHTVMWLKQRHVYHPFGNEMLFTTYVWWFLGEALFF